MGRQERQSESVQPDVRISRCTIETQSAVSVMMVAPSLTSVQALPPRYQAWIIAAGVVVGMQLLVWGVSDDQCTSSLSGASYPPHLYVLHKAPNFVMGPLISAAFVANLIDHRGRYLQSSEIHRWTWRYAVVSCMTSEVPNVAHDCTSLPRVAAVAAVARAATPMLVISSQAIISRIALLRLRMMTPVVPRLVSVGQCIFRLWATVLFLGAIPYILYANFYSDALLFVVLMCCSVLGLALYFSFLMCVVRSLLFTARASLTFTADHNEAYRKAVRKAAAWTQLTSALTCLSFGASVVYLLCTTVAVDLLNSSEHWILAEALLYLFDLVVNILAVGTLSGLWGPVRGSSAEAELLLTVQTAAERRAQIVQERLSSAIGARAGNAATLAALIGRKDPSKLISEAIQRFRCISWDVLAMNPTLILGDTKPEQHPQLDGAVAATELYELSHPCQLSECDVFLSHSWHDDKDAKWAELSRWCEDFRLDHGRSPTLWLDKVCINQSDITRDLECLPIFLAGCNNLLVLSGRTYTTRAWCILELFVYITMQAGIVDQTEPTIVLLGKNKADQEAVKKQWRSFQAQSCTCFLPRDKDRIMAVIEASDGGINGFNKQVIEYVETIAWEPDLLDIQQADDKDDIGFSL
eukprot:TRINITY_DN13679_c0_g2_i15.p1 TRINITY_DN13679_c0_g2~~TRINITY_DN13679_c0_g2_i15.p1  ORF type:complete len:638 (+),score=71.08 TRINITY_DN13679_c0_g2_i15:82-1995(+)